MKSITLEMSLKPFKKTDSTFIKNIIRQCLEQYKPLLNKAEEISIMLWCGDGSELFDYKGKLDESFEWAYFVGGANQLEDNHSALDPHGLGLHTRNYLYTEQPPVMTYAILKEIVETIKSTAKEIFGSEKSVVVGETVDVGPEFAISDFKYTRHPELCTGGAMGKKTMLCAYEKMHADSYPYASYPGGVPEGEPFGTFFGKQAQIFLSDLGFDYIWFSNGMGFGRETWSSRGATFDGQSFDNTALSSVKEDVLDFWKLFRNECPDFEIRTRGTNLSLGIDYATDGVPLKAIYDNVKGVLPPPNSPWAALDGDFGLELMGYMSRIAEVPDNNYLFRFYLHDIWWANSPWYDRYGSQPHDIYMPLAISRIDKDGKMQAPSHMHILSIDNCFGEMPELCVYEPMPHYLKALKETADAPSPFVWVYPFNRYCSGKTTSDIEKMYNEDWFIRGAINNGLALSSVTSTDLFLLQDKSIYASSIIITPVPEKDSDFEKAILEYTRSGGKVIFYGSCVGCGEAFKNHFGIKLLDKGLCEKAELFEDGKSVGSIKISPLICAGEVYESCIDNRAFLTSGEYALGIKNPNSIYLRSVVSSDIRLNSRLPVVHNEDEFIIFENYLRKALQHFGYHFDITKENNVKNPCITLHRHNNAHIFSLFLPSTDIETRLEFPLGAPILDGYDVKLCDGKAIYHFPKSEHRECRLFVKQQSGTVGCKEVAPVSAQFRRTITLSGLKDAEVYCLAENYCKDNIQAFSNKVGDFFTNEVPFEVVKEGCDTYLKFTGVSGSLHIRMPFPKEKYDMLNS